MVKKNLIWRHFIFIGGVALIWSVYMLLDCTCPIFALTHIPCPTCGCTRATICFFCGDFAGYRYYQPFAFALYGVVLLLLHTRLFRGKMRLAVLVFAIAILLANFGYYIYRLCLYFG